MNGNSAPWAGGVGGRRVPIEHASGAGGRLQWVRLASGGRRGK
jgi:hypothetical protein